MKRPLSSRGGQTGFTLAEILVAIALCVVTVTCFYAATGQAIRIARSGKQETSASQVLQHRFESLHATKGWGKILSPVGVKSILAATPEARTNLHVPTELYTVSSHPTGTPQFTVTRNPDGTLASSGTALPASVTCVKVVGQVQWTGIGNKPQTRQQVSLLTRGGI